MCGNQIKSKFKLNFIMTKFLFFDTSGGLPFCITVYTSRIDQIYWTILIIADEKDYSYNYNSCNKEIPGIFQGVRTGQYNCSKVLLHGRTIPKQKSNIDYEKKKFFFFFWVKIMGGWQLFDCLTSVAQSLQFESKLILRDNKPLLP